MGNDGGMAGAAPVHPLSSSRVPWNHFRAGPLLFEWSSATYSSRGVVMKHLPYALLLCVLPLQAAAQEVEEPGPPTFGGGINLLYGSPQGEFSTYVEQAWGVGANLLWTPAAARFLGLRLEGGFMNYGHETYRVPLSGTIGGRVLVDLTTDNNIAWIGIGPQVMVPSGPIRPYANAAAGLAYFATTSSVRGDDSGDTFASDTNYDDAVFQWAVGGGTLIPVARGRTPVSIDLSARYHGNGRVSYVTEGGIEDNDDGSITINAIESEARVLSFHIGVAIGFGRR